jgi:peptidoglycan/LPS O-acetylase OafA/YrhL
MSVGTLSPAAYRGDIDGLRAVAVLAVLAFHAFPGRLTGGFSGVDVFFVISGFLISRDICKRLDAGQFSLLDFYERRIRRIFPALIVVLVPCAVFGWVVLLPDELQQLLAHVATSAAFVQNFRLLAESGYFDSQSALKPLLHLWSLSIEEQFYLLCPLLLMAVRSPRRRLGLVVVLWLLSFGANVNRIATDPTGAYYLPHTRFWEILAGVALALALALRARLNARACDALAGLGTLLLLAGFVGLNKDAHYPGWWGLVPTLGAVALIAAGPGTWLARHVFARPTMTFIGRISYPLYLWHWPVLAFIRILDSTNAGIPIKVLGLAASFILAVLTYRFVEQPLRRPSGLHRKAAGLALGMIAVGSVALALRLSGPALPRPFAPVADNEGALRDLNFVQQLPQFPACSASARAAMPDLGYCLQGSTRPPTAAILGDSHAYHVFYGVAPLDTRREWLMAGNSSCPPVLGIHVKGQRIDCKQMSATAVRAVADNPSIQTVVLAFLGSYVIEPLSVDGLPNDRGAAAALDMQDTLQTTHSNAEMMFRGLARSITVLENAGKRVVLFVDVPALPFQPADCVDRPLIKRTLERCSVSRSAMLEQQATLRRVVQRLAQAHPTLRTFDPLAGMCDGDTCAIKRGDMLVYRDGDHLSLRGSAFVAGHFLAWLGP